MKFVKCFYKKIFVTAVLIFMVFFSAALISLSFAEDANCVKIFDYSTNTVKVLNANDNVLRIDGQQVASYDAGNVALTLSNYRCELLPVTDCAISANLSENEIFTIKILGENLIKNSSDFSDEILGVKDVIRIEGAKSGTVLFCGDGSLTVDAAKTEFYTCAVYAYGNLKIENAKLDIASYGCAIHSKSGVSISGNSKLNLKAQSTENGKYLADGIYTDKNLTISQNAKVIAQGFDTGLYSSGGDINILDDAVVESNAMSENHPQDSPYAMCGILADNNIFIRGNAKVKAYGLDCGILAGDNPEIAKSNLTVSENAVVEAKGKNGFGAAAYGQLNILDSVQIYARTDVGSEDREFDICALQAIGDINVKGNVTVEVLGDTYGIAAKNGNINLYGGTVKSFGQGPNGAAFSKKPVIFGQKYELFAGNDENTSGLTDELDATDNSKFVKVIFPKVESEGRNYIIFFIIAGLAILLAVLIFYILRKLKFQTKQQRADRYR